MVDNSFRDYILDEIKYHLVTDNKGMLCLETTHYSGHYSDWKPIQYLDEDEIEELESEIWDDVEYEYGEDEIDWEDYHEIFEDLFYQLVDKNLGR